MKTGFCNRARRQAYAIHLKNEVARLDALCAAGKGETYVEKPFVWPAKK